MYTFHLQGKELTGTQAQLHFQEWALDIKQEMRWPSGITALAASEIFFHAYQSDDRECQAILAESGLLLTEWAKVA